MALWFHHSQHTACLSRFCWWKVHITRIESGYADESRRQACEYRSCSKVEFWADRRGHSTLNTFHNVCECGDWICREGVSDACLFINFEFYRNHTQFELLSPCRRLLIQCCHQYFHLHEDIEHVKWGRDNWVNSLAFSFVYHYRLSLSVTRLSRYISRVSLKQLFVTAKSNYFPWNDRNIDKVLFVSLDSDSLSFLLLSQMSTWNVSNISNFRHTMMMNLSSMVACRTSFSLWKSDNIILTRLLSPTSSTTYTLSRKLRENSTCHHNFSNSISHSPELIVVCRES